MNVGTHAADAGGAAATALREHLDLIWLLGTYEFAAIGLIVGIMTIVVTIVQNRRERELQKLSEDLSRMRDQQSKINNTLIVTSDLALASLPPITFTQQIPGDVMDAVGIIDDIFEGPHGASLWDSVAAQPRAARLAYARAIYKFGLDPVSPANLGSGRAVGKRKHRETVLSLLERALQSRWERNRDPISLQRDILVRKCQVLRQAGEFQESIDASKEIGLLKKADSTAIFLEPWCKALAHLQWAMDSKVLQDRHEKLNEAKNILVPYFRELFGEFSTDSNGEETSPLSHQRQNWPKVEPRSIAYYTAKSHWCYLLTLEEARSKEELAEHSTTLHRALDLSLLFYQTSLNETSLDAQVRCSYSLCVAFLIAVKAEVLPNSPPLKEFRRRFEHLSQNDRLNAHAIDCLDMCQKSLDQLKAIERRKGTQYIYTERTESLDILDIFEDDIDLVRSAIPGSSKYSSQALRNFYRKCR